MSIKIAVASPAEQQTIDDRLRSEAVPLDRAVTTARAEIALLREYRTRLIADVVTGKRDVRAAAAGLPDIDEDTAVPEPLAEDSDEAEEPAEDLEAA